MQQFERYDIQAWHEDTVLLSEPSTREPTPKRRRAPWTSFAIIALAQVCSAEVSVPVSQTSAVMHLQFSKQPFQFGRGNLENADVIGPGFWVSFEERWNRLKPLGEDDQEDPDPIF